MHKWHSNSLLFAPAETGFVGRLFGEFERGECQNKCPECHQRCLALHNVEVESQTEACQRLLTRMTG
jgi:hypothetical protein